MEEENTLTQERFEDYEQTITQMKSDIQTVINFKNDLEALIEEQTQHIEKKNKRLQILEETLAYKETELEKKENTMRRLTATADDQKKKLMGAEVKLR